MPKAKQTCCVVPQYTMTDHSMPNYELIIEELHNHGKSQVGTSYFYIKKIQDGCSLCRILYGGGKIYFHEVLDHKRHGISDDDIDQVPVQGTALTALPDHYFISSHIEMKLHALINDK